MLILGLNDSNSAAAIIHNGKLLAAAREERFNRIKFSDDFPVRAVQYCLSEAGADIRDVDQIAFGWNPGHEIEPLDTRAFVRNHKHFLHWVPNNLLSLIPGARANKDVLHIREELGLPADKHMRIAFLPHHASHAAGAFYLSSFEDAAIVTCDGYGDDITMEIFHGRGNRLRSLAQTKFPYSLGGVYAAVTQHLGFRANSDEWKVMGLASYGDPQIYAADFRKLIGFNRESGTLRVDLDYFSFYVWASRRYSDKFEMLFGPERQTDDVVDRRHMDLAAGFQFAVEELMIDAAQWALEKTGSRNLCLSGGSMMNSKMNGRLVEACDIDGINVQSSADDGGVCLGAAYLYWNGEMDKARDFVYSHDYWGPGYSDEQIRAALDNSLVSYRRSDNIAEEVAGLIEAGNIVGWFQGRQEYGQRALGNRSILADPRKAEMKDKINAQVKHREEFRPFAPSILEEYTGEYFTETMPAPFMQQVYPIKPGKRAEIPAVVHVDGTGRLQTVSRAGNALYYELIDAFRKRTGVPLVLNTSFNDNDEPIVTSPKHALRCFFGTGLEVLCLGNYIIEKR